jgi:hypothetical protein
VGEGETSCENLQQLSTLRGAMRNANACGGGKMKARKSHSHKIISTFFPFSSVHIAFTGARRVVIF